MRCYITFSLIGKSFILVSFQLIVAGKSYAIFVAKLPMNATVEELEKVFKQFGPIKRDGIQVRSNKV